MEWERTRHTRVQHQGSREKFGERVESSLEDALFWSVDWRLEAGSWNGIYTSWINLGLDMDS